MSIALSTLIENAGFVIRPGQLELFPNPKPYRDDGMFSLFNAHRLPLQIGSYLLNADFQPMWSDRTTFVQHWQFARSRNEINATTIKRVLKQFKRQTFRISGKADKYLNDLNAEIELGWTGQGQTNRLLGRIAMRSYVFHHVLTSGKPLTGQALVSEIVQVAQSLPGYLEFCRHQHEIGHRAEEWARCVESSHYFHYGDASGKYKAQVKKAENQIVEFPKWNQQQSQSARSKIQSAIADLLEKDALPSAATGRFKKLLQYRIGGGSLYRHKDLWHPQYLSLESGSEDSSFTVGNLYRENVFQNMTSLLPGNGGNDLSSEASNDSEVAPAVIEETEVVQLLHHPPRLLNQPALTDETWQAVMAEAERMARTQACPYTPQQVERMKRYLDSGDPILVAEAMAWVQQSSQLRSLD